MEGQDSFVSGYCFIQIRYFNDTILQLFGTFNPSGILLTTAGFLASSAQYFSATSTNWSDMAGSNSSSLILSLLFSSNTLTFALFNAQHHLPLDLYFHYLWEETINVTTTSYVEDSFVACAFFLDLLFLIWRVHIHFWLRRIYRKISLISSGDFVSSPSVWAMNLLWTFLKLTLV